MVPPEVRPMMEKHGIYRMFVGQYELIAENQLGKMPSQAVASLNTHDMFPFAAFWEETDIVERQKLKLIDPETAQKELEQRRQTKMILLSILKYRGLNNEISQDTGATTEGSTESAG
jgi:4-alpha-glucanotransferase